jgi:hypothetical protein
MNPVFTSVIFNALKLTLEGIIDDKTDNVESTAVYKKWMHEQSMADYYEDDLESAGPGLAAETEEGGEIPTGTIKEGYITRYIARKWALKLIISEEAAEDTKYPEILRAAQRLKRALWKTVDIDTTNILVRATNAAYPGGDGVALASASHTLPFGGTFSNLGASASPSKAAVVAVTTQIKKYPGHDGITEGYMPVKVVCPVDQWATWSELLGAKFDPVDNNFARPNVVNTDLNLTAVPIKHWNNTTTDWAVLTDAPDKINIRWRRRPRSRNWVENSQEVALYGISARWARGWSDPRAICFVDA